MTLVAEPYRQALRSLAESVLAPQDMLDPDTPLGAFWLNMLAGAELGQEAFVVAHDGVKGLGLGFTTWRPLVDGNARMAFLRLPDDVNAAVPVGCALCDALLKALAQGGVNRLMTYVSEDDTAQHAVMKAARFTSIGPQLRMCWQGDGTPVPETPVDGVTLSIFRGGDTKVTAEIADLFNRMFAHDEIVPDLTIADIERLTNVDKTWFVVARDGETGACVGIAEAAPTGFFSSIAVARRYWGTGLAGWIGTAAMNEYIRCGVTDLYAYVDAKNRAARALHKREGWKQDGEVIGYLSAGPRDT